MKPFVRAALLLMLPLQALFTSETPNDGLEALNRIIAEHEALLQKYPDGEFAAQTMMQLAELYYEQAHLLFRQSAAEKDSTQSAPDMRRTIDLCLLLLEKYPDLAFRDKVLYLAATAYLDAGLIEDAQRRFEQLTTELPQSPLYAETRFRLAEILFDRRLFEQAAANYRLLIDGDEPYGTMAFYKLGWSCFNLQRYSEAVDAFLRLLDKTADRRSSAAADLTAEAVHYLADSFIEGGGTAFAEDMLAPRRERSYVRAVLEKMAQLYEGRALHLQAVDAYRRLLAFYPFSAQAPDYYRAIVRNLDAVDPEAACAAREELVAYFLTDKNWAQHAGQDEVHRSAREAARESLAFIGQYHQARGQVSASPEEYRRAVDAYRRYLEHFPDAENSGEIHYYLAECHFACTDFGAAAEAYREAAMRYPDSPWREKAAFNRIFSRLKLRSDADPDTLRLPQFLDGEETLLLPEIPAADAQVLIACNDFYRFFSDSDLLDQVLMTFGQVLYERGAFLSAAKVYQTLIERTPNSPYRTAAIMNTGRAYFDAGHFRRAQEFFLEAAKTTDDQEEAEKARRMTASAQFKIAENLSREGRHVDAAVELLKTAAAAKDTTLQARAFFEAALRFQQADSLLFAARTFEQLALRLPRSELADQALFQAAALRERLGDWPSAAADYRKVADNYPASPLRLQAFAEAARCFENAEELEAALDVRRRMLELCGDCGVETACRAGETAQRLGRIEEAERFYRQAVERFEKERRLGRDADPYFAAQAQFMIGELLFERFKALDLAPPFESRLRRKTAAFTEVVRAYSDAAKYQIADWTTAALFRIGESFEELVRALLEAPLPENLTEEQQLVYRNMLAERARPYREKALEAYERNLAQAEVNQIDNHWIEESRLRAEELRHALNGAPSASSEEP